MPTNWQGLHGTFPIFVPPTSPKRKVECLVSTEARTEASAWMLLGDLTACAWAEQCDAV